MFISKQVYFATEQDIPALENLINKAYRGKSSEQGWTTEAGLIAGDRRTDMASLQMLMQQQGSYFLKYIHSYGEITGCVNLQVHGDKVYLGMLCVHPLLQAKGTGSALLYAAEQFARSKNCNSIYMSVISLRKELIDWYKKNGYKDTGERKPFVEDAISGRHLQPLEFLFLEKRMV